MSVRLIPSLIIALLLVPSVVFAGLASDLSGKILLQVEENGEAWYVYPKDEKRYFLNRPDDAYQIMRSLGLGITDVDLSRVLAGESALVNRLKGYILLQVEQRGEAYYVNPDTGTAHYMKDGTAAFSLMRSLGLGITNEYLSLIASSDGSVVEPIEVIDELIVVERRVFEVVNAHRATLGVASLELNETMIEQARGHSVNMASGVIEPSHDGFDGRAAVMRAEVDGYNGGAENLAWNYSRTDPGQSALDWWLTSPGHRASLENDFYDLTGIGVAKAVDGKYFVTQMFANTD